ncbi:type ISP restriction/modification enzyme [Sphingopyxis sp. OPL5]|uniref:type ISP restriction/modification enzyme n=1 Tax=Sphingopyxis sp. OPL5 TaxID=2486273 RepID=UPI001CA40870|nr:type ISP restriction/modification enzyme [Sphingopyxis sp. OPL5]
MVYDPVQIAEEFFESVRRVRALGAGTPETAYYPALHTLFERVGSSLSPKVLALSQLGNIGAGSPDFGLFAANQVQKGEPRKGQMPERGVVEVKPVADDSMFKSTPAQLAKYYDAYSLVLVTNMRAFQLVGPDVNGTATRLEAFVLADTTADFWSLVQTPGNSAKTIGLAFVEYLRRALTQNVALVQPKDVAWFLASYARDALARVDAAGDLPALKTVRTALEDALGITFDEEKGDHFFRSTLVQTLFYGLFSAWVIWARATPRNPPRFDWRSAGWSLHVPFIQTLFQQLTAPQHIKQLDLVEVLDWTGNTLNRIDAAEFLKRFDQGEAVQYFYEPFLEAFDPKLRKQFGVWYTPAEIVDYMVARVDRALKDELEITDGLADERVYVLDPCCGTGGFINSVLRRIRANLESHGLGDALADRLRDAARNRVFGFEIMPAPFVVAHMQAGMALANMDAPLAENTRPAIYLTNALTGWEPHTNKPLPFPELEAERASADAVKQATPILVILGNPPYDGYAGIADNAEERALTSEYRKVKKVAGPQGQGLNELYVRFFRMAERRIAEKTGEGVISFISNYSWLDSLSFPGMRERYLEMFDSIAIDCLNGDKYKTGKTTPEGLPDPSIFSTPANPAGIQVGTAIATLVRKKVHKRSETIAFRHLWGTAKRETLAATAETDASTIYSQIRPELKLRLPFEPVVFDKGYLRWPLLPELLPVGFPGVKTSRDEFLVDIDRDALEKRLARYFDPKVSDADLAKAHPTVAKSQGGFNGPKVRAALVARHANEDARATKDNEPPVRAGRVTRYAYRPFDVRWLYWDPDEKLLDRERADYLSQVADDEPALSAQQKPRGDWQSSQVNSAYACLDLIDRGSTNFPRRTVDASTGELRYNFVPTMLTWLKEQGHSADELFNHIVATLHAPSYGKANAGALRMDWPRVPLAGKPDVLTASAQLGEKVAALLDAECDVAGVSSGSLKGGLAVIALPKGKDFQLAMDWGSVQINKNGSRIVMPGDGNATIRAWTDAERDALDVLAARHGLDRPALLALIGEQAVDVHINADAKWEGVPAKVWAYALGGYQVLKKWLSYREAAVLGRPLTGEEALHFAKTARRITEILCMGPALDAAHAKARDCAVPWIDGKPGEIVCEE